MYSYTANLIVVPTKIELINVALSVATGSVVAVTVRGCLKWIWNVIDS